MLADSAGSPEAIVARFAGLTPSDVIDELATTLGEVATRSAVAWKLYRDAAAVDAEIAADWHELQSMRRVTMRRIVGMIPADALRAGLSLDP